MVDNAIVPIGNYGDAYYHAGLPFGLYAQIASRIVIASVSAGNSDHDFTVVPSGEIWVYTHLAARYAGTVPTQMYWSIDVQGVNYRVHSITGIVTGMTYGNMVELYLIAGDNLQASIVGGTAGNSAQFYAFGYIMKVAD